MNLNDTSGSSFDGYLLLVCVFILLIVFTLVYFVIRNRQIINDLDTNVNKYINEDVLKLNNIISAINYNDNLLNKRQKYIEDVISKNDDFSYNYDNNENQKNETNIDEENDIQIIDFSNDNNWNVTDTISANNVLDNLLNL